MYHPEYTCSKNLKEWLMARYEWGDEAGRALKPETKCGPGVSRVEDMEEAQPCGPPGCKVELATWAAMPGMRGGIEEPHLAIECDGEKLDHATCLEIAETARNQAVEQALSRLAGHTAGGGPEAVTKKAQYRRKMKIQRQAVRRAMRAWRYEQRARLKKYSRRELLRTLVPGSESKLKTGSVEGLTKKQSKDTMSNDLPPTPHQKTHKN